MPLFRFDGNLGYTVYQGQVGALQIGLFANTAAGPGFPLTSSKTFAHRICADDGRVLLGAAAYRAQESRLLLTMASTGVVSAFGAEGHAKITGDLSGANGPVAGQWGYAEHGASAKTALVAAGVRGTADLPTGATIPLTGVLSAFLGDSIDLSGTHTGKATVFHVPNPGAGTWDYFALFGTATGCNITSFAGNGAFVPNFKGTFTQVGQIKINIGATDYYIPYGTVA